MLSERGPACREVPPPGVSAARHACQGTSVQLRLAGGCCGTAGAARQIDAPRRCSAGESRDEACSKWGVGKGRHLFSLKGLETAGMGCWLRLGGRQWENPSLAQPHGGGWCLHHCELHGSQPCGDITLSGRCCGLHLGWTPPHQIP